LGGKLEALLCCSSHPLHCISTNGIKPTGGKPTGGDPSRRIRDRDKPLVKLTASIPGSTRLAKTRRNQRLGWQFGSLAVGTSLSMRCSLVYGDLFAVLSAVMRNQFVSLVKLPRWYVDGKFRLIGNLWLQLLFTLLPIPSRVH
jgi:hypothetical protein